MNEYKFNSIPSIPKLPKDTSIKPSRQKSTFFGEDLPFDVSVYELIKMASPKSCIVSDSFTQDSAVREFTKAQKNK